MAEPPASEARRRRGVCRCRRARPRRCGRWRSASPTAWRAARSSLLDAAHTAGVGRSHFAERLAVVADSAATAREALLAHVRGESHPALHVGTALPGQAPELVFMFTGQGAQYPGMAERLMTLSPVFRAVIDDATPRSAPTPAAGG